MQTTQAETTTDSATELQYLTFSLAEEEYAVNILKVREIRSWREPTPLPHAPEHVLGVINLRGAIIPIVDLRKQFCLPDREFTSTTGVIVVQSEVSGAERHIGIVVDEVLNVIYLADNNSDLVVGAESTNTTALGARFVSGLRQKEDGLVIIIDLDAIIEASLSDDAETVDSGTLIHDA